MREFGYLLGMAVSVITGAFIVSFGVGMGLAAGVRFIYG